MGEEKVDVGVNGGLRHRVLAALRRKAPPGEAWWGAPGRAGRSPSPKQPLSRAGRAVEKGETQGFMKAIIDAETKQILGAAILGNRRG
jgi:hypothetical protein